MKKEVVGPERSNERISEVSYAMNPYALRTCAVGASCHVLTDLKLNIVEFSVFRYTISWYITRGKMQGTNNFITLQELFIVTQENFRMFQFSMSFTSCEFRWHKQYDSCNRFHFQIFLF